jgi:cell wall-associated NlpC family hydrolase
MKHGYLILTIILFIGHSNILAKKPYKAVVIAPIADAVGSPIKTLSPEKSPTQAYAQLPLCAYEPLVSSCCPRLHQLLFNEIGTVVKEEGQEVLIQVTNCFYITQTNNTPHHSYWTLKKNILSFNSLEEKGVDTHNFPPPISFQDPGSATNQRVGTLVKPWHDATTQRTYSAGTRFLKTTEQPDENFTTVHIFDPSQNEFVTATVPNTYLVDATANTTQKKLELFVHILKNWAHQDNGAIPYVWGGCSFTQTTDQPYTQLHKDSYSFYEIKGFEYTPRPGLDCSNLILRAAQLAGIPFFFKNSHTTAVNLKQLTSNDQLAPGDIIWIPGHVLIVVDVNKNTLIEARGYKYKGQGKIQEIALNQVFKKIDSFDQLVDAKNAKRSLERLGADGSVVEVIKNFKLLSMRSIME